MDFSIAPMKINVEKNNNAHSPPTPINNGSLPDWVIHAGCKDDPKNEIPSSGEYFNWEIMKMETIKREERNPLANNEEVLFFDIINRNKRWMRLCCGNKFVWQFSIIFFSKIYKV